MFSLKRVTNICMYMYIYIKFPFKKLMFPSGFLS